MINEFLSFAGDVKVEELKVTSIPTGNVMTITNQVIGMEIYEDLFSPFISGYIVLKESLDILNNLPLTGQEWLEMKVRTPTFEDADAIRGLFYVYKISEREFVAERNVVYKLHFISVEALFDSGNKYSKGFEGKISDIARQHLEKLTTRIGIVEPTKNNTKYVSNFWSPVKNLNFLTNNAINQADSPSYLFFENRNGFNFMSLNAMYNGPEIQDFNYNFKAREIDPASGESARVVENDYKRITEISLPTSFDTLTKMRKGTYASTLITHDLVSKRYRSKKFEYLDKFDTKTHLNSYPLTGLQMSGIFNPNTTIITNEIHYGVFNGYGDVSNSKNLQERLSDLSMAEGLKVIITVPGRTDYTVGKKVSLKIVKPEPIEEKDEYDDQEDKIFSGSYIIGAINHVISREDHVCTMELIKDSWAKNINRFNE